MSTWTLVIIMSWLQPCNTHNLTWQGQENCDQIAHASVVVPGFHSREACKAAMGLLFTQGRAACVSSDYP